MSAGNSDQMVGAAWHYIGKVCEKELRERNHHNQLLMAGMDTGLESGIMCVKYLAFLGYIQKLKSI